MFSNLLHIFVHKWEPWSDPKPGMREYARVGYLTPVRSEPIKLQERYCAICHKQDVREAI